MKHLVLASVLLALPAWAVAAAPNLHVGAMYEYIAPGTGAALKRVRNSGVATAFVRVQVTEVRYGPDGKPVEHAIDSGQVAKGGSGLIASPSRLIVPAQGQQATRLLFQGDRSVERYYRVRFIPVLPRSADEFALSPAEREQYRQDLSAGVNVLTGYGVFVIVHADTPRHDIRTETLADRTVLRNAGNATVVLDDVRHCSTTGKSEQCSPVRRLHLLPGRSESFVHAPQQVHRFQLVQGEVRTPVQLDPLDIHSAASRPSLE